MSAGRRTGRRDWGWHPLTDRWARRIVADADVGPGDLVLDLGAGGGALTRPLLAVGARVVAVELHPGRVAALRAIDSDRLTVVRADAREVRLPSRPFRVVANLPFAGATAIVRHLLSRGSQVRTADLVVQHGAALGLVDARLPQAVYRRYGLELDRLPRNAFRPPPRVDVAVLRVRRR